MESTIDTTDLVDWHNLPADLEWTLFPPPREEMVLAGDTWVLRYPRPQRRRTPISRKRRTRRPTPAILAQRRAVKR